tara:strand:+ start:410 stop:964 length:555 start_codon:yes stop_codon:yes gene_type:complete
MTTKNANHEYGKGNTFTRKDGTVVTVTKLPSSIPEPGDILFYKKRDWKKKRLREMNQWKFVCVETQGQERGKWKVQGLHKELGDFNWFEPHYLMRSSEVTNDLISKNQYTVKEDTKVKQKEKDVTPEELGSYGANYQSSEQPDRTEHKATTEMKNYNYKRVISENLRMIKSLVHQTNELLEKIQ